MTWHRSSSQWFRLPADRLWEVLSRLEDWPAWNPAVGQASLTGPLREGSAGHYSPAHRLLGALHRRTAPAFTVLAAEEGRRILIRQTQPGGHQDIEWTLAEREGGTVFTQRVSLEGPLAQQFGLTAGEPLVQGFAAQCARLYRLARPAGAPGGADDGGAAGPLFAITGGTGFLGGLLAADLVCDGQRVVVLTRSPRSSPFEQLAWDGRSQGAWAQRLAAEERLSVVNLAGLRQDRPGSEENLAAMTASRVDATRALVQASAARDRPVEHWLQQSAVGIYGDSQEVSDEGTAPPQPEGLAKVVTAWEASAEGARAESLTVLRSGVVLHRDAPLMARLATPARLGAGGHLGTGSQWFSWIHATDWIRAARAALGLAPSAGEAGIGRLDGIVNATAPHPVQNRELMAHLREFVGVPVGIPAPPPLLRAAAAVLRTNPELVLASVRAVPSALERSGFAFRYPQLAAAFREMAA